MISTRQRGAILIEAVAAISVLLPVVVLLLFIIVEVSYVYMAHASLSTAANVAARRLAIDYGRDPAVATSRAQQESDVLDAVRLPPAVVSSSQFTANFDTTVNRSVTVSVVYQPGAFTLPPLPVPDPLGIGPRLTFNATATYPLQ